MTTALVLRTCAADGTSYNGFRWPLEVGAVVEAPDWDHKPECGNGLHGALHGEGDGSLFNWSPDAVWMVVEADDDRIVELGGKVKFPACVIRHVGDQRSATDYIMANDAKARAVIGATVNGGYCATVTGGYRATVIGGDGATVTGGHRATVTGGDGATVTGGGGATVTGGDGAILQIKWYDGKRYRIATAYVGENDIIPNVPYRLDAVGNFVRADK